MDLIDPYLESISKAFSDTGRIVPWPIHIATIFPYFCDLEATDLFGRLKQVAPQGRPAVAKLHINGSVARALLMDLVPSLKLVQVAKNDRCWFTETVLDSIHEIDAGDIFCRDGAYRKWSEQKLATFSETAEWHPWNKDPAFGRAAYRLTASAQALVWSLFFYGWTDVAFEIHGPYRVRDREGRPKDLVVREFFDLHPNALWPELGLDSGEFRSVVVLAEVDPEAGSRVDVFNHLTHRGSLHERTSAVAVFLNDAPIGEQSRLAAAQAGILSTMRDQHKRVAAFDRNNLIHRFIETRYYALRHWRTPFGRDWRPPPEVRQRLQTWEPIFIPLEGGPSRDTLRRAYDPRDDFHF